MGSFPLLWSQVTLAQPSVGQISTNGRETKMQTLDSVYTHGMWATSTKEDRVARLEMINMNTNGRVLQEND